MLIHCKSIIIIIIICFVFSNVFSNESTDEAKSLLKKAAETFLVEDGMRDLDQTINLASKALVLVSTKIDSVFAMSLMAMSYLVMADYDSSVVIHTMMDRVDPDKKYSIKGRKELDIYLAPYYKTEYRKDVQYVKKLLALAPDPGIKASHIASIKKGRVVGLDLKYMGLEKLPAGISCLDSLKRLNLNTNNFKNLPNEICELSQLQELDVRSNYLESLPDSIGKLKDLICVLASNNKLKTLPESIGNLSKVTNLDLINNKLEMLPYSITKIKVFFIERSGLEVAGNKLCKVPSKIKKWIKKHDPSYLKTQICP